MINNDIPWMINNEIIPMIPMIYCTMNVNMINNDYLMINNDSIPMIIRCIIARDDLMMVLLNPADGAPRVLPATPGGQPFM